MSKYGSLPLETGDLVSLSQYQSSQICTFKKGSIYTTYYLCHTSNFGPTKIVLSFKTCETKKQQK